MPLLSLSLSQIFDWVCLLSHPGATCPAWRAAARRVPHRRNVARPEQAHLVTGGLLSRVLSLCLVWAPAQRGPPFLSPTQLVWGMMAQTQGASEHSTELASSGSWGFCNSTTALGWCCPSQMHRWVTHSRQGLPSLVWFGSRPLLALSLSPDSFATHEGGGHALLTEVVLRHPSSRSWPEQPG